jgi:hypothetical protein
MNDVSDYVVVYVNGDAMHTVFRSPKLLVALAVCNMLNGGDTDILASYNNLDNGLTTKDREAFSNATNEQDH